MKKKQGVDILTPSTSEIAIEGGKGYYRKDVLAKAYLDKDSVSQTVAMTVSNNIVGCCLTTLMSVRPSLLDYDQCVAALKSHFELLGEKCVKPTISGIAQALGLSRELFLNACETGQVYSIVKGTTYQLPANVWELLISLRDNYVSMLEGFMESGAIHPACGIFLLKNNGNYKEVVEQRYTVQKTIVDATALAQKYKLELDGE